MGVMEGCRKWKVRKKVGYEAQQRFWISKGWKYRNWNLLVGFNRWCKLLGDKEIWAFEHEVCERYIVYGFVLGTGPCTNYYCKRLGNHVDAKGKAIINKP